MRPAPRIHNALMRAALLGAALLASSCTIRADVKVVGTADPPEMAAFRAAWTLEIRDGKLREAAEAYLQVEKGHAGTWFAQAARVRRALCLAASGDAEGARKAATEVGTLPAGLSSLRPLLDRILSAGDPPPPDPAEVKRWIAGLSADDFQVRQEASRELVRRGKAVLPTIREALKSPADLETRIQLESILLVLSTERWAGFYEQAGMAFPLVLELTPGPDGALEGTMREPAMCMGDVPKVILVSKLHGRRTANGAFILIKQYENVEAKWKYDGRLEDGCVRGLYVDEDCEPTEEERRSGENRIFLRREALDLPAGESGKQ